MILAPILSPLTPRISSLDADAKAFLVAAGITDATQSKAVNGLVKGLKSAGLWTKMVALYPFVGGAATPHSFNLINPAQYQITWHGTITHDATGFTGDGSTGYGDTGMASNVLSAASNHMSIYARNVASDGSYNGCLGGATTDGLLVGNQSGCLDCWSLASKTVSGGGAADTGLLAGARVSLTDFRAYRDGTQLSLTQAGDQTGNNFDAFVVTLGGFLFNDTVHCNAFNIALASIGSGMTQANMLAFAGVVQQYESALSRAMVKTHAVVFDGDSIPAGFGLSGGQDWPAQAVGLIGGSLGDLNHAISGQTLADMLTTINDVTWALDTYRAAPCVVAADAGTNDIAAGADETTTYARWLAYVAALKAYLPTVRVAGGTILPRSYAGTPGTFDATRLAYNTLFRNGAAANGYSVMDFAVIPGMGAAGDETNTTNYQDLLHPTAVGAGKMAAVAQPVLTALLRP